MKRRYQYPAILLALGALLAFGNMAQAKKKKRAPKASSAKVQPQSFPATIHPELPESKEGEIVFVGVGDMMIGSSFPDESGGLLPPDDGVSMFSEVAPILQAADIAFGNLEGPLLDGGKSKKCSARALRASKCFAFRTPTHYGKYFKDAGFDLLSLANNHAMDFGKEGRVSTRNILDELGITHSGEVGHVGSVEVKGKKIALLAFAASKSYLSPTFYDLDVAKKMVEEAEAKADIVVVSFHGGREGARRQHFNHKGVVDSAIKKFAHTVVDAGADIVIGHGPHVLKGMEIYKDRLIAYSLGNFATYRKFNLRGPNGLSLILEVRFGENGTFLGGQLHPVRQDWPGGPILDPTGEAIRKVQELSKKDFKKKAVQISDDGALSLP